MPKPQSKSFCQCYGSTVPTSLTYFVTEAAHFGDLMWLWVRTGVPISLSFCLVRGQWEDRTPRNARRLAHQSKPRDRGQRPRGGENSPAHQPGGCAGALAGKRRENWREKRRGKKKKRLENMVAKNSTPFFTPFFSRAKTDVFTPLISTFFTPLISTPFFHAIFSRHPCPRPLPVPHPQRPRARQPGAAQPPPHTRPVLQP